MTSQDSPVLYGEWHQPDVNGVDQRDVNRIIRLLSKLGFLFHRGEKGFSLPEVVIGMTVFAMVSATFISTIGTSFNILSTSDQHTVAESLARAQMDKINNAPYNGTSPYTYDNYTITGIPAGYNVSTSITLVDPQTGNTSATDLGIQKITVTVTSQRHSPAAVVVLQAYKR